MAVTSEKVSTAHSSKKNNHRKDANEENKVLTELREKMHRLKFRLLEQQNQNQMLRKELLIANKVMGNNFSCAGILDTQQNANQSDFKGHEDNAISLRNKIIDLQNRINKLEGEESSTSDEPRRSKPSSQGEKGTQTKRVKTSVRQMLEEELVASGTRVKAKIDYWKNRNKELREQTVSLRLELERIEEKSKENQDIRRTFLVVERELRDRQNEKLNMRSRLDVSKTRNEQLVEELAMAKEDVSRMSGKTRDDKMLLEALTSQQDNFKDLIERQKSLCDHDNRRFREQLRQVQTKYSTGMDQLNQLQELLGEKRLMQHFVQDSMMHIIEQGEENMGISTTTFSSSEMTQSETQGAETVGQEDVGEVPSQQQCQELERLRDEYTRCRNLFESSQEEVERITEIAMTNNKKLNEWKEQLFHSKALYAQKNAELRELEVGLKRLSSSKKNQPAPEKEIYRFLREEMLIKKEIENEEHRFLLEFWHTVLCCSEDIFRIYSSNVHEAKKLFVIKLRHCRRKPDSPSSPLADEESSPNGTESP